MTLIFGQGYDNKQIHVWGPTATVETRIEALSNIEDSDNWALVGMQAGATEIVDVRQCFNDEAYLYAMGNDLGQCRITLLFAVFLSGPECDEKESLKALKDGIDDYVDNRISKRPKRTSITIGELALYGWLSGLNVGSMDPERGVCSVAVTFIWELGGKEEAR